MVLLDKVDAAARAACILNRGTGRADMHQTSDRCGDAPPGLTPTSGDRIARFCVVRRRRGQGDRGAAGDHAQHVSLSLLGTSSRVTGIGTDPGSRLRVQVGRGITQLPTPVLIGYDRRADRWAAAVIYTHLVIGSTPPRP